MRKLFSLMTPRERIRLPIVLAVLLAVAGVEVLGVAAIAGFIALVSDPEAMGSNRVLSWLNDLAGPMEYREFLPVAGLALFAVIVFRNGFGAFAVWVRLAFLHTMRKAMATRLLASYMAHPFSFFHSANSAALPKNITYEVNQLITSYLYSWLMIIADFMMLAAILGILFFNEPLVTLVALVGLGGLAGGVLMLSRRRMHRLGQNNRRFNEQLYKTTGEAIGGIKEIKVLGRERFFIDKFFDVSHRFARNTIVFQMFVEIPRFGLEIIIVGGLLVIAMVMSQGSATTAEVTTTLTLFVAAFYRLMPSAHRLFTSFAGLQFNRAILDDLTASMQSNADERERAVAPVPEPMPFDGRIELEDVSYRYGGAPEDTIRSVSLSIPKNASVAFVGPTGVGKTTLVDIILGLLAPSNGRLLIDGTPIEEDNVRAWRRNVGYVPQVIYLADDTIRRNIALGVPEDEIDDAQLQAVLKVSHLSEFVDSLPDGVETVIGERGIRLSGGQRQRIGIARALYGRASVLVLDEATSSLDGITEAVIEDAIRDLHGRVTVITIAHRLTTVRDCDTVYMLQAGQVAAAGGYAELLRDNETFRQMARATG